MLTRKKRLIILSVILSVALILVILASTLFTVKSVRVEFKNKRYVLDAELVSDNQIIDSAKVQMGSSILFSSVKKYEENIEKNIGYAQVVKIERVFPNSITLHIAERTPVVLVYGGDGMYYVLDRYLKVLRVSNYSSLYEINGEKDCPTLSMDGLKVDECQMGDFIENETLQSVLMNLFNALHGNRDSFTMFSNLSVTTNESFDVVITLKARSNYGNGYIRIVGINDLHDKALKVMRVYNEIKSSESPNFEYIEVSRGGEISKK